MRRWEWGLVIVDVLLVLVILGIFIWHNINPSTPSERNAAIGLLVQMIGGAVLLIGLFFTWRNLTITQENADRSLKLVESGQIMERYSRAIEQLANKKQAIRLGAIYTLKQIARSYEEHYWPIMEVLLSFIREHSSQKIANQEDDAVQPLPLDIQAVITVLRECGEKPNRDNACFDLSALRLPGANFEESHFSNATFEGGRLSKAQFKGCHLENAIFFNASVKGADFSNAYMAGANFYKADLSEAKFFEAHLEKARFEESKGVKVDFYAAHLEEVSFTNAQFNRPMFYKANLTKAHLQATNLFEANFKYCILKNANFSGAKLRKAVFDGAELDGAEFWDADLGDTDLSRAKGLTWEQIKRAKQYTLFPPKLPTYLIKELEQSKGDSSKED
jgi:uncharacterized protein YjbI with pentapeptide repeats